MRGSFLDLFAAFTINAIWFGVILYFISIWWRNRK